MAQKFDYTSDYKRLLFHPHKIFMLLSILALFLVFFFTVLSYIYILVTSDMPPIELPWLFLFNTVFLLASSYSIRKVASMYKIDNTSGYQTWLWITLGFALLFIIFQFLGWSHLNDAGLYLSSPTQNTTSFLWVVSILHLVHVLGGLVPLLIFIYVSTQRMKDPVSVLIYFSDPEKKLRLRMLSYYWHFLDLLWIFLVVVFMACRFIF